MAKLTKKQLKKRKQVAEAIARENPGISMERKFKIATRAVKKGKK